MRWNYRKKLELSIVLILFLLNLLFFFSAALEPAARPIAYHPFSTN
jgi:hypothetical protein